MHGHKRTLGRHITAALPPGRAYTLRAVNNVEHSSPDSTVVALLLVSPSRRDCIQVYMLLSSFFDQFSNVFHNNKLTACLYALALQRKEHSVSHARRHHASCRNSLIRSLVLSEPVHRDLDVKDADRHTLGLRSIIIGNAHSAFEFCHVHCADRTSAEQSSRRLTKDEEQHARYL